MPSEIVFAFVFWTLAEDDKDFWFFCVGHVERKSCDENKYTRNGKENIMWTLLSYCFTNILKAKYTHTTLGCLFTSKRDFLMNFTMDVADFVVENIGNFYPTRSQEELHFYSN